MENNNIYTQPVQEDEKEQNKLKALDMIGAIAASTSLDDVTAESDSKMPNLPNGYFLSELKSHDITLSKTNKPMVRLTFTTVEDGVDMDENANLIIRKNTKNRYLNLFFLIDTADNYKNFVSSMLKFEDSEGNPLLVKEAFETSSLLDESLLALSGFRVYINVYNYISKKDNSQQQSKKIISWERAKKLNLESSSEQSTMINEDDLPF